VVTLHEVELVERQVEPVLIPVLDFHELSFVFVNVERPHGDELADAVLNVDDRIARRQIPEILLESVSVKGAAAATHASTPEDLGVGAKPEGLVREAEPSGKIRTDYPTVSRCVRSQNLGITQVPGMPAVYPLLVSAPEFSMVALCRDTHFAINSVFVRKEQGDWNAVLLKNLRQPLGRTRSVHCQANGIAVGQALAEGFS
jgi:hypothetical protein